MAPGVLYSHKVGHLHLQPGFGANPSCQVKITAGLPLVTVVWTRLLLNRQLKEFPGTDPGFG